MELNQVHQPAGNLARAQARAQAQENMRAAVNAHFEPFAPQHIPQDIRAVAQDGPNCGCFAAAMAVSSLEQNHRSQEAWVQACAARLQTLGQEAFQSALGEFFNAQALETVINAYFEEQKKDYLEKTITVVDLAQFKAVLQMAHRRGIKVLLPHFAGDQAKVLSRLNLLNKGRETLDEKREHIRAEFMDSAHWAVVNTAVGNYASIKEGNQNPTPCYDLKKLYDSNLMLGRLFNWTHYFSKYGDTGEESKRLNARKAHPSGALAFQHTYQADNSNGPPVDEMERVDLSKKLILIGKRAGIQD